MKNCPRCSFLMDDHEAICETCAEQDRGRIAVTDDPIAAAPVHGVGTAVLERPTVVPLSESATFRAGGGRGVSLPTVVIGAVIAALLTAGVVTGLQNQGPLAVPLQQIGLIEPPVVVVPDQWVTVTSAEGGFSVSMPAGVTDAAIDEQLAATGVKGFAADLGEQGRMLAVSTDLGRSPAEMQALDTDAGFATFVDFYVSTAGLGEETVRREVQVSHGRAIDSVLVLDDEYTTRVRFMMTGGRFVVLSTAGHDSGASALDEAHPKLVDSFDLK